MHLVTSKRGHSIAFGRDRILGMDDAATLSPQPIAHLHSKNFWYLYRIRDTSRSDFLPDSWITSASLGLNTELSRDWNNFCSTLTHLGIHLSESEDLLQWSGGILTVQNVYAAISNLQGHTNVGG